MKRTIAALLLAGILAGCSGAAPTPAAPSVATMQSDYIMRIVLRMAPSLLGAGTFRVAP